VDPDHGPYALLAEPFQNEQRRILDAAVQIQLGPSPLALVTHWTAVDTRPPDQVPLHGAHGTAVFRAIRAVAWLNQQINGSARAPVRRARGPG